MGWGMEGLEDKLRAKHNADGRHAHLHGRTSRRRAKRLEDRADAWRVEGGHKSHAPYKWVAGSNHADIQVTTAVEEELYWSNRKATCTPTSLNKHKDWDSVINLLEENAVHVTKQELRSRNSSTQELRFRSGCKDRTPGEVKYYYLEPTGIIARKSAADLVTYQKGTKHKRNNNHNNNNNHHNNVIYYAPDYYSAKSEHLLDVKQGTIAKKPGAISRFPRPTKVFAKFATAPPATVKHRKLPGKMTDHLGPRHQRRGLNYWISYHNHHHRPYLGWECKGDRGWCPEDSSKGFLEVDLGLNCVISDVSTMGGTPATVLYPQCHLHEASWSYDGESYVVLAPSATRDATWVDKYEILVRVDGGRDWQSLGEFKGNTDCCNEVAHSLSILAGKAHPDGVVARFVRIRPISGGGLRMAVYGRPISGKRNTADEAERLWRTENASKLEKDLNLTVNEAEAASNLVAYRVVTPNNKTNRLYSSDTKDGTVSTGRYNWRSESGDRRKGKGSVRRALCQGNLSL